MRSQLLVLTAALLLGAGSARAQAPAPSPPPSASLLRAWHPGPWQPAAAGRIRLGLRVAYDPVTGEMISPAEAAARTSQPFTAAPRPAPIIETRPDGSRHAYLGGSIRNWSVAEVAGDGRLRFDCVHGRAVATAAKHPAPAPAKAVDR